MERQYAIIVDHPPDLGRSGFTFDCSSATSITRRYFMEIPSICSVDLPRLTKPSTASTTVDASAHHKIEQRFVQLFVVQLAIFFIRWSESTSFWLPCYM